MEHAMAVTTQIDPSLAKLLIDASIQSYYAFDQHDPAHCNPDLVTPPPGYDLVDCWTGIDTVFGTYNQVECFGVVFRSQSAPYTYIFSFRTTYSFTITQNPATRTLRIQNTYDVVPCAPPELIGYQHVGDAYLVAFYNKDAG